MQLFCIPFAGGSKNAFRELALHIDEEIDVVLLEYPGHDSRASEKFCTSIQELRDDINRQISNSRCCDIPYSILGYSMGSVVTYELIVELFNSEGVTDLPTHVFLCANEALSNYSPRVNFSEMTQEEIQNKLISMGGIDERFLNNPRFLKVFLRPVEADYRILEKYKFVTDRKKPVLSCSIFYSENDTAYVQMKDWENLFDGIVDFYQFGNNHFFIHTEAGKMAKEISRILSNAIVRGGNKTMDYSEILSIAPYSLNKEEKTKMLTERVKELTFKHMENCEAYRRMMESIDFDPQKAECYEDYPFLPVRLFKELDLKSVPQDEIFKTMTSSGTSGQAVSKIYLDRTTASNQQKTMVKIVSDFTGAGRMPMLIIDCPSVVKNRMMFSARGAGILGFSMFGADKAYALNDNMQLDIEGVQAFLKKHEGKKIFMFGFTFMVWQHFYKELVRLENKGIKFDLSQGIMIHGGGWKKLISEAASPEEFHQRLKDVCGLDSIHDYYGMVEQTGCIYMQCECGHLHASIFSDVIIRDPRDFSVCKKGETGIIQVVSAIPESYPGHSLLTEDEGILLGEDDCPCGRKGKYFKILGRLKNAEIRGCSDTYAAKFN